MLVWWSMRRGAGLPPEPLQLVGVARRWCGRTFRPRAGPDSPDGLVDDAHAAAGDLAEDPIVAQPLGNWPAKDPAGPARWIVARSDRAELLDRHQRGEQLVDLVGELRVLRRCTR